MSLREDLAQIRSKIDRDKARLICLMEAKQLPGNSGSRPVESELIENLALMKARERELQELFFQQEARYSRNRLTELVELPVA